VGSSQQERISDGGQLTVASDGAPETRSEVPLYSWYVLGILFLVYVFNFIDRQILSILIEPIKKELGVSDTAMGFLSGLAFALFYSVAGLPIARWADRGTRRSIIALGLTVWSGMTAACGLVHSFSQLALARVGVGVGEAAGTPPAHSLISDYFAPDRRATALAIYSMGIYAGVMIGFLAGGWIEHFFDWRTAFFVVGVPGLALALLVRMTVREPPRGQTESGKVDTGTDSVPDVMRFLFSRRSFVHLQVGGSLHAFATYGMFIWIAPFLSRVHGMPGHEIGSWLGPIAGIGGGTGAYLGGVLADRLGKRDVRWYLWLPALTMVLAIPFVLLFLMLGDPTVALLCYIPYVVLGATYSGPTYAMTQAIVKVRMRAIAVAIHMFIVHLIGMGGGPQVIGILSDLFRDELGADSIRYALLIVAVTDVVASVFYLLAARTLRHDIATRDT
jgi:predicted MFS family arabinose efflux permease